MNVIVILLIIITVIVLVYAFSEDDTFAAFCGGILLCFTILLLIAIAIKDEPSKHKLSEDNLSIEIQKTTVNNKTVSVDTIYVFTPKKK